MSIPDFSKLSIDINDVDRFPWLRCFHEKCIVADNTFIFYVEDNVPLIRLVQLGADHMIEFHPEE